MPTFLVTYWTGNSEFVEAATIQDAARANGYYDLANGCHVWEIADDSLEVTNSDGELVASIEVDYGTMDVEVEFPNCETCGEPIDYCQGHGTSNFNTDWDDEISSAGFAGAIETKDNWPIPTRSAEVENVAHSPALDFDKVQRQYELLWAEVHDSHNSTYTPELVSENVD